MMNSERMEKEVPSFTELMVEITRQIQVNFYIKLMILQQKMTILPLKMMSFGQLEMSKRLLKQWSNTCTSYNRPPGPNDDSAKAAIWMDLVAICIQIDELCIKHDELYIKNHGFCIQNDDFNPNVQESDECSLTREEFKFMLTGYFVRPVSRTEYSYPKHVWNRPFYIQMKDSSIENEDSPPEK